MKNTHMYCIYGLFVVLLGGFIVSVQHKRRISSKRKHTTIQISVPGDPMTADFQKSVSYAIHKAQISGKPVARYDREHMQSYLEYPDGRKVYRNEA